MALSESELIIQAKSGNDAAFEELVFRYDKTVLGIALRFTSDNDEAKDVYQEVFIRVYKGLKNFEMKSEFSTWLYRITTNVCLTHKSRSKKNIEYSISGQHHDNENEYESFGITNKDADPEEYSINRDIGDFVNKAVESLSAKQRITFILKHYEGYKIREIASMLNCKEGTIKKYLFDAIRTLRKKLEPIHQNV